MTNYSTEKFVVILEDYLSGKITEQDLYTWNCGFLKRSEQHKLRSATWAVIHQLNEVDPDIKTTTEELTYMLQCLKGLKRFHDSDLQLARDEGLKKRFERSPLDVPAVHTTITKDEIISTIREIRERGWEKEFRDMAQNQDDSLMDVNSPKIQNQWDKDKWTW